MSDIVLRVENIWKQYRLGLVGTGTLRDDLARFWAKIRGKEDPTLQIGQTNDRQNITSEYVWALQDINFEVKRGEVVGIIGKNGAGKSTLLKILSKVTSPTKGQIKTRGRIASLLEVGTGFHPELTGRENIFLNGAILGMTKNDIKSKFDEIVEFSGIGNYIDTPVKRYSSGMYVRLAFAVAAHLDPEILIIDEVLAVGDAEFQKKCLGKMKDVAGEGRTVLFVSHNMTAIRALCSTTIVLQNGRFLIQETSNKAIDYYNRITSNINFDQNTALNKEEFRRGNGFLRFTKIKILDVLDNETNCFEVSHQIRFKMSFILNSKVDEIYGAVVLKSGLNGELITSYRHQLNISNLEIGSEYEFEIILENPALRPGEYPLYFWLGTYYKAYDVVDNVLQPLIISAKGDIQTLGYDPSIHTGYFFGNSKLKLC